MVGLLGGREGDRRRRLVELGAVLALGRNLDPAGLTLLSLLDRREVDRLIGRVRHPHLQAEDLGPSVGQRLLLSRPDHLADAIGDRLAVELGLVLRPVLGAKRSTVTSTPQAPTTPSSAAGTT